jgi:PRD1 phage membrane DNA delivery
MHNLTEVTSTFLLTIAGVAIVALLVSKKSQTPAVLQAGFSGYNNALAVAVAPVTGAVPQPDLQYPNSPGLYGGLSAGLPGFPQFN